MKSPGEPTTDSGERLSCGYKALAQGLGWLFAEYETAGIGCLRLIAE